LHWPERSTNCFGVREFNINEEEKEWHSFESILQALEKYIKIGKIRYIGISNETPYGLSKYLELSKSKNLPRIMSIQNPYSLVNRTFEIGMSEISIRDKCGLLAYYPLAAGALSGKYRDGQMPKNSRMALFKGWERMINPLAMKAYDEYYKLANDNNMTMVQLAQSFVNSRPFVTSNIIGATTMEQLKENIDAIDIELSDEIMNKINLIHNNNPNPSP
jgi:aryl-alcohol dehydrogenase-like predicted oxidoreductase